MKGLKAEDVDWDELEGTADTLLDTKKISNLKAKLENESNPVGQSFDAVAHLKRKSDKKDKFYLYKMNKRCMNPDEPSYVFKTSKLKVKDKDKNPFLSNEYCHIDVKVNRCKYFPTITLSVYHPVVRKQLPLFTMECEGETAECYAKFFTLINETIEKAAPGSVFNPLAGFMADEAGGIQEGLRSVYGVAVLERSRHVNFIIFSAPTGNELVCIVINLRNYSRTLLEAQTSSAYHAAVQELKDFVAKKPAKDQRGFLTTWFQWWDNRRSHVFPAFARKNAPATNLAEVIHSKWKTTAGEHLSLQGSNYKLKMHSLNLHVNYVN